MEYMIVLPIIAIFIVFFFACAAGIEVAVVCIFKVTEKIIKAIENFFDNL